MFGFTDDINYDMVSCFDILQCSCETWCDMFLQGNTSMLLGEKTSINTLGAETSTAPLEAEEQQIPTEIDEHVKTSVLYGEQSEVNAARALQINKLKYMSDNEKSGQNYCTLDESRSFDFGIIQNDAIINPVALGLAPKEYWVQYKDGISLSRFVVDFLRRRMTKTTKFEYKLFNILRITLVYPHLTYIFGAEWITDKVFRIHKQRFADALDIKNVAGVLFHRQGNFPCHGFREIFFDKNNELTEECVGAYKAKGGYCYMTHNYFSANMSEKLLQRIKYKNEFKKLYGTGKYHSHKAEGKLKH